jgi:hypothetical protein
LIPLFESLETQADRHSRLPRQGTNLQSSNPSREGLIAEHPLDPSGVEAGFDMRALVSPTSCPFGKESGQEGTAVHRIVEETEHGTVSSHDHTRNMVSI